MPRAERGAPRRPAYVLTWEDGRDRRCLACGRWVSEATTSGMDLRRRLRVCESCVVAAEFRRAVVRAAVTRTAALALSGAA